MSEIQALFSVLKQTADPGVVDAIQTLVEKGEDRDLNRVNLLDLIMINHLVSNRIMPGQELLLPDSPAE